MGILTADKPKPLLEVAGEPLIDRQLRVLAAAGVREVVVNVAYRGAMLRQALGDGGRWGVQIRYSDEGSRALETAGGIIQARHLLGPDPFLLVSCDVIHDFDLTGLGTTEAALGCLVMVPNPSHHPDGDFGLTAAGRLTTTPPRLTFAGLAVLDPALFDGLPPGRRPLREVLKPAIAADRLSGVFHDGLWVDVGTPSRLRLAEELLQ
jgi:MurNAc alpha-1-phosphate uridylyltransferase